MPLFLAPATLPSGWTRARIPSLFTCGLAETGHSILWDYCNYFLSGPISFSLFLSCFNHLIHSCKITLPKDYLWLCDLWFQNISYFQLIIQLRPYTSNIWNLPCVTLTCLLKLKCSFPCFLYIPYAPANWKATNEYVFLLSWFSVFLQERLLFLFMLLSFLI